MRIGAGWIAVALMGSALTNVTALAATTVTPAGSLAAQMAAYTDDVVIRTPKPAIAALPDLLERARADRKFPIADLVRSWHTLAFAHTYDGKPALGVEELDKAIAWLKERVPDDNPLMFETQRRKAIILGAMGKGAEARAILEAMIARYETSAAKGSAAHAAAMSSLAIAIFRGGDPIKAETIGRRAVAMGRAVSDIEPLALADATNGWLTMLHTTGRYDEAVVEAERALQYCEQHLPEDSDTTTTTLNNLAVAYSDVGRHGDAERMLRRSIAIEERNAGSNRAALAMQSGNFAATLAANGKLIEADAVYGRAIQISRSAKYAQRPDMLAIGMLGRATVQALQGRLDDALAQAKEAEVWSSEKLGREHPVWANAKAKIGKILLAKGDPRGALAELEAAMPVIETKYMPNDPVRTSAELALAQAQFQMGDKSAYQGGREAMERQRNRLLALAVEPAGSVRLAQDSAGDFIGVSRMAFAAGKPDEAFSFLQMALFAELDTAGAASAARRASGDPDLTAAIRKAQDANAALRKLQSARAAALAAGDNAKLVDLDQQITQGQAQSAQLVAEISQRYPAYAAARLPTLPGLNDVQRKLGRDDALLLAFPGGGGVYSVLVTRNGARSDWSKTGFGVLPDLSDRMRQGVDEALAGDDDASFDLGSAYAVYSAMVPRSLEAGVKRAKRLYVMAGGVLQSVPFAALVTERPKVAKVSGDALRQVPWLVRRQAVAVPASLSLLGQGHANGVRSVRFAGIGAPVLAEPRAVRLATRGAFGDAAISTESLTKLPSLPSAQGELEKMRDTLGGNESLLLTGPEALKSRIMAGALEPYSVLAFATHGLVSGEVRGLGEPALVLSPPSGSSDAQSMLLTASDIAQLKLDADWVVLSACNTAAGEEGNAPTYSGLARAFVYAGARSLLLSQWALRDDVAARLTVDTIRAARDGRSHAEALRHAQLALIADPKVPGGAHPAAWAPFILLGE